MGHTVVECEQTAKSPRRGDGHGLQETRTAEIQRSPARRWLVGIRDEENWSQSPSIEAEGLQRTPF